MRKVILQVTVEKLHRTPEECPAVTMARIWEIVAIEDEKAKQMDVSNG